jgi:3-hydroxybutyryl-CoA dehydrogenase
MQALSTKTVIGVIGAGAMGAGIAQVAASAGHPVKLYDLSAEAVIKAIEGLAVGLDRQVTRGKLDVEQAHVILARISPAAELDALADAGLVIEAVVERLDVKQSIFSQLESICGAEVILASNTSSISITALGAALQRPERLAGMHFFNPPQAMKLVEVIAGLATDEDLLSRLMATAQGWGKQAVRTKSTPGFIVNRVARPFYAEALRILQDGIADCRTIDEALTAAAGFRMGPFALMDLIGHDVNYAVTESVFQAYYQDPRFKPSIIQQELVSGGFLGRKSGRGFYRYDEPMPAASYLDQAEPPSSVSVVGKPHGMQGLIRLAESRGLNVLFKEGVAHSSGWLEIDDCRLALTNGSTATERSVADKHKSWLLVDLVSDFKDCAAVTVACSDLADSEALDKVGGFFQALGKQVLVVDDAPAMVAMRTVCMLANEAADAVKEGVAAAAAVDLAMQLGTNYPQGPLAWAEDIGLSRVLQVLEQLYRWYGEDRYRSSSLLRRLVINGGRFHD